MDQLVMQLEADQVKKTPLPAAVKLIILLAAIIFLFICTIPVLVALRLIFR